MKQQQNTMVVQEKFMVKVATNKGKLDMHKIVDKVVCIYESSNEENEFIQSVEKEFECKILDVDFMIDLFYDLVEQDCLISNVC